MRRANQLVGKTLGELAKHIGPGVTTLQLDRIADEFIRDHGAVPTFKGVPNPYGSPFPASICTSVNDVVVHGIPSESEVLKDGDIISVDCGTLLDGFNGDSAYTFCVGEVADDVRELLRTTRGPLPRDRECCRRTASRGYRECRAGSLREGRLRGRARAHRTRHRPRDARGTVCAKLRTAWKRHASQGRNVHCHRTHDNNGRQEHIHDARQVDDTHTRRETGGAFRAHHSSKAGQVGDFINFRGNREH